MDINMGMKPHIRPVEDFRISSVAWELDIEARHEKAGFDPVSRDTTLRRFFMWVDFLQQHRMTTRTIAKALDDVDESTELRNHDLTDEGFDFVRHYHGRWLNRSGKDSGAEKERKFLDKWLKKFRG
jgi:hypothetical protein